MTPADWRAVASLAVGGVCVIGVPLALALTVEDPEPLPPVPAADRVQSTGLDDYRWYTITDPADGAEFRCVIIRSSHRGGIWCRP